MELNTIEKILTWFYGRTKIIKYSFLSGEISRAQMDDRMSEAINIAHDEIIKLKEKQ